MTYSIDSIHKDDPRRCWDQHVLTESWWLSRVLFIEVLFANLGKRKVRVRSL